MENILPGGKIQTICSAARPVVGRLAPSPTGAQHIGNARTYLLAWLSVRSRGGKLILRMEDIDSPRIKPGAAEQAYEDLRWLGLDWDAGPDIGGSETSYVQTERLTLYTDALEILKQSEAVYPCTCTRSEIEAAASAPHTSSEPPRYPGTCARRTVADAETLQSQGQAYAWRLRTGATIRTFTDRVQGRQTCGVHEQLGDFVVAKMDGAPAYQLAVVVDDAAMGITEVLRGDDLLLSTFRQLELYDRLHLSPPSFAHVPLVVGDDGRRLAKRHGDTRLSLLREQGVAAERLLGLLAQSCGLRRTAEPVRAAELLADFSLSKLPPTPLVFTQAMFQALLSNAR